MHQHSGMDDPLKCIQTEAIFSRKSVPCLPCSLVTLFFELAKERVRNIFETGSTLDCTREVYFSHSASGKSCQCSLLVMQNEDQSAERENLERLLYANMQSGSG